MTIANLTEYEDDFGDIIYVCEDWFSDIGWLEMNMVCLQVRKKFYIQLN